MCMLSKKHGFRTAHDNPAALFVFCTWSCRHTIAHPITMVIMISYWFQPSKADDSTKTWRIHWLASAFLVRCSLPKKIYPLSMFIQRTREIPCWTAETTRNPFFLAFGTVFDKCSWIFSNLSTKLWIIICFFKVLIHMNTHLTTAAMNMTFISLDKASLLSSML